MTEHDLDLVAVKRDLVWLQKAYLKLVGLRARKNGELESLELEKPIDRELETQQAIHKLRQAIDQITFGVSDLPEDKAFRALLRSPLVSELDMNIIGIGPIENEIQSLKLLLTPMTEDE